MKKTFFLIATIVLLMSTAKAQTNDIIPQELRVRTNIIFNSPAKTIGLNIVLEKTEHQKTPLLK